MTTRIVSAAYLIAMLCGLALVVSTAPASARGAAPSIMDSPGYQRALAESRKQLTTTPVTTVQPMQTAITPKHHHRKPH
jgi:hypothetical protein